MEISATDIIEALRNQRNSSQDENAQLYAMLKAKDKQIAELEAKLKKRNARNSDTSGG